MYRKLTICVVFIKMLDNSIQRRLTDNHRPLGSEAPSYELEAHKGLKSSPLGLPFRSRADLSPGGCGLGAGGWLKLNNFGFLVSIVTLLK